MTHLKTPHRRGMDQSSYPSATPLLSKDNSSMKGKKYSTWKHIWDYCHQCKRLWSFEGWDDSKRYRDLISRDSLKLCKLCAAAKRLGEYRYRCEGCALQVVGPFELVHDLLNVFGKAFCRDCMNAFYGLYNARNPALLEVLARMAEPKTSGRAKYLDSEASQRLYREETRYADAVRRLSRTNFRKYPEIVNPRGHKLGRSGAAVAYQLDHIVPVSVCWNYGVTEENASSIHNLQVVPWFVNSSRGNHFDVKRLVK